MSIKTYGIYLSSSLLDEIDQEDVNHLLGAFLQRAMDRSDIRFFVICPSNLQERLYKICQMRGIALDSFDMWSPPIHAVGRIFISKYKCNISRIKKIPGNLKNKLVNYRHSIKKILMSSPRKAELFVLAICLIFLQSLIFFCHSMVQLIKPFYKLKKLFFLRASHYKKMAEKSKISKSLLSMIRAKETAIMLKKIKNLSHVKAWYSPFISPSANHIPFCLIGVQKVAARAFPIVFAERKEKGNFVDFKDGETVIRDGKFFTAQSHHVKWNILVAHYAVNPNAISVIPRAPHDLSPLMKVSGFLDNNAVSRDYSEALLNNALNKASNLRYTQLFKNKSVKFLFYAGPFHATKNILKLLEAFVYLRKEYDFNHKLILTGDPSSFSKMSEFIRNNSLIDHVLCLANLTMSELAACYKSADVVVNPSVHEMALPFTFTKALSVDTPVVMAKIPATEELITDDTLKDMMLFDAYNYKNIAEKIKWAVANKGQLLKAQQMLYGELIKRNWDDVVDEHVILLDRISSNIINFHPEKNEEAPNLSSESCYSKSAVQ